MPSGHGSQVGIRRLSWQMSDAAVFEDGEGGLGPRNEGSFLNLGKGQVELGASRKELSLPTPDGSPKWDCSRAARHRVVALSLWSLFEQQQETLHRLRGHDIHGFSPGLVARTSA